MPLETIITSLGMATDGLHFTDTYDNDLRLSAVMEDGVGRYCIKKRANSQDSSRCPRLVTV